MKGINNSNAINGSGTTYIENEVTQTAEIAQDLAIKDNATLIISADNIKSENDVTNNGRLALVGGTLNKGIASDGVTEVRDDLTIAEGGSISGNSLELGSNDLTVSATTDALNLSGFTNQNGATLNTQNGIINGDGVTLELDSSIVDSEYTIGTTSESKDDKILANTLYNPEGNYFNYTRQGDVLGKIDLTDDQKGIKLSESGVNWKEWEKGDSLGDTLMLVNTDETNEVKTLNFATQDVNYKVSDDAGETKGSVAINGVSSNQR